MLVEGSMSMIKVVVILATLLAPSVLLDANAQDKVNVQIADGAQKVDNGKFFVPARITVEIGTTVTWTNLDDAAHTITSGTPTCTGLCWGLDFDSGKVLRQNDVYGFTFDKAGSYDYLCALHPWMIGRVTVVAEGASLTDLSVVTDKSEYKPGDKVRIKGSVSPVVADQPVLIEVLNPTSAQFRSETAQVKTDGAFSYDFELEGDLALPGSYTVKVKYSDASTESSFVLVEPEKPDQQPPVIDDGTRGTADVKVVSKQIKDLLLIRVTNDDDSEASIYGMSIEVPNSTVQAFRGPSDWSKPDNLSGEISSSTLDNPIEPGKKGYFKLKIGAGDIVINWTAYDDGDNMVDEGETKPISRR